MPYTYAVLGAGRQGTVAAYDMARWGGGGRVILADRDLEVAARAAERVNTLIGGGIAEAAQLDVTDLNAVQRLLTGVDACLSAVPYVHNLDITRAAISARAHLCDLGGNTDIARQQHALDAEARKAGVSTIPNCGQVPGMGTSLMVYAIELLDEAVDVYMWDGGIPQEPRPPFNYLLTFNIAGLTNEYAEPAVFLRDWKVTEIEPMTELETVHFPKPIGTLEAFVAGGGTDTMPWTYQGRLRTLQNKTLRHPGHFAQLRAFYDLGLWDLKPIRVGGVEVVPRNVFHTLFEPRVAFPGDEDIVIVRVKAVGKKNGRDAEAMVEVIDYFDEATRFTAMERCTGWSAAIVAEMMAGGCTPHGAGGVETQVPARPFVEELRRRGLSVSEQVTCGSVPLKVEGDRNRLGQREAKVDRDVLAEIDRLVHPRSVAIIGASAKDGKVGRLFMDAFIDAGFQPLYPINPHEKRILGFRAYSSVKDVPEEVDLAIVATPPHAVLGAVKECVERGVRGAVIYSAGFGEKSSGGKSVEQELGRLARESGTRLLGPNCLGIYCPRSKLPFPSRPPMTSGVVGMVSQSGSFGDLLSVVCAAKGVTFSKAISVGNECDLTAVDILEYLGQDPETEIIVSYLEGIKDGQRFYRVARSITPRKPIIVWKCGTTERGARAAFSHTGTLAGSREVWKAVLKQAGIVTANSLEQVMDLLLAFRYLPLPRGRQVVVLSGPGGPAVGAADACVQSGLELAELSAETRRKLAQFVPAVGTSLDNPVDLGMNVLLSPRIYGEALKVLAEEEGIDVVLVIGLANQAFAETLLDSVKDLRKPLALALTPPPDIAPQIYLFLVQRGIPAYGDARRAAEAIAKLAAYREFREEAAAA